MDNIVKELASQLNISSNEPNKLVANKCINNPDLLDQIVAKFTEKNKKLVGDCVEVLTEVALVHPNLVIKYANNLIDLLQHKETRVRWEAMHALALITKFIPEQVKANLSIISQIMLTDKSVIVRDYATDTILNYAIISEANANIAFPLLIKNLEIWNDRHAGRVINGFIEIYKIKPSLVPELKKIAVQFKNSTRKTVQKAALKLDKLIS